VAYIPCVQGKLIYLAMAQTYEQSGDIAGAEAIYQKALKRPQYKKSKKVWIQYHQFKLRTGDADAAKAQLSRSLQSLSRHKHVEVISKYAMSEFDFGSAERGRNVFEELLTTYPKRTDLWHLYVDKEVKLGNVAQARQLFERMITAKASARNMKAVFKKYLAFETSHGTEQTVEEVKQKARDYVSSMA
jgi:rRNA biogenesis protein RRP5